MDIENDPEIPNEIRKLLREAADIGGHAEAEAFATFMRIIDTADDAVKPIAMIVGATKMLITVRALQAAVTHMHPKLERLVNIGLQRAEEVSEEGAREFRFHG